MEKRPDEPVDTEVLIDIRDESARQLARAYLERRRLDIVTLRRSLVSGDLKAIAGAGHRMYGSGGAYGIDRVSEIGAALEADALAGDAAAVSGLLDDLEGFLSRAVIV